jgi:hypothetical protein
MLQRSKSYVGLNRLDCALRGSDYVFMTETDHLIAQLALAPHPEGGWYRETFRHANPAGGRGLATAILFLLEAGQRSHWHRVDAHELWLWHSGSTLALLIDDGNATVEHRLGRNVTDGERPQLLVPAHAWQAAEARAGWALVSCVVTPAFEFSGFTLAPEGWTPGIDRRNPIVQQR